MPALPEAALIAGVPAVAASSDLLYVANTANNSVSVYRRDAQGNMAPVHVIAGSKTKISAPGNLAEDAAGNLYVADGAYSANGDASTDPAILVFAHGADGNTAPARMLAGPATGIDHVAAITVDRATGKLYVEDYNPETLAPKALSVITGDGCGLQLALGYLRNIYVTHSSAAGCPKDAVYVYAPTASGNAAPLRVLSGPATRLDRPYGIYEGK